MKKSVKKVILTALIAAVYAALTFAVSPISYGPLQFRISESLIMLAAFTPLAVPGLTLGCVLANLMSPYGIIDILLGSSATLLATLAASVFCKKIGQKSIYIIPLVQALFNAVIVGAELAYMTAPKAGFVAAFLSSALYVGLGELVVGYVVGLPLYFLLKKLNFKKLIDR